MTTPRALQSRLSFHYTFAQVSGSGPNSDSAEERSLELFQRRLRLSEPRKPQPAPSAQLENISTIFVRTAPLMIINPNKQSNDGRMARWWPPQIIFSVTWRVRGTSCFPVWVFIFKGMRSGSCCLGHDGHQQPMAVARQWPSASESLGRPTYQRCLADTLLCLEETRTQSAAYRRRVQSKKEYLS
ncbi:hypothetical protein NDU88_007643 [Pleurodeles waltl]|uniref:Uncharacterized protein n=1 Tax=Pleurodeles waltl TaxID=8319 RepID=A0AAV7PPW3_PLEWA|nr:hypothetical protein NDU88_007643 [Pleurodeles waltl]